MSHYDPNSLDSMFTRLMTRLEQQDREAREFRSGLKESVDAILEEQRKTNGRVTRTERFLDNLKARFATAILIASSLVSAGAWMLERLFFR